MGPPEAKLRPSTSGKASSSDEASGYHYIIIGAGASGCVLASVLANAHPDRRIALLDMGPPDVTREVAKGATGDAKAKEEAKVGARKRPRARTWARFHFMMKHRIHPCEHIMGSHGATLWPGNATTRMSFRISDRPNGYCEVHSSSSCVLSVCRRSLSLPPLLDSCLGASLSL
jgi:D-serine deaminase-like pyridoxal phosphate-dependent protein